MPRALRGTQQAHEKPVVLTKPKRGRRDCPATRALQSPPCAQVCKIAAQAGVQAHLCITPYLNVPEPQASEFAVGHPLSL